MQSNIKNRIIRNINIDAVRKLLVAYFVHKFQSNKSSILDRLICPAWIADMTMTLPQLVDKVEIVPSASVIDSLVGYIELEWNLFVMGSHRMYLGTTRHNDAYGLILQLQSGTVNCDLKNTVNATTPRKIINFITKVLSKHPEGYVDMSRTQVPPTQKHPFTGQMATNQAMFAQTARR